jgi:hypothetical protein
MKKLFQAKAFRDNYLAAAIAFLLLCITQVSYGQAASYDVKTLRVIDSMKLGNNTVGEFSTDTAMSGNSDKKLATQKATRAYVDNRVRNVTESDPVFAASPAYSINSLAISNWNAAYGWGNHAGLYPLLSGSYVNPSWIVSLPWNKITSVPFTSGDIANWNTAFGWGNHAGLYPLLSGSYVNPSWITSLAYSKLTGTPDLSTYVSTAGTYANPSWLTSLGWAKLTGVPNFDALYASLTSVPVAYNLNSVVNNGNTASLPIFAPSMGAYVAGTPRTILDYDNAKGSGILSLYDSLGMAQLIYPSQFAQSYHARNFVLPYGIAHSDSGQRITLPIRVNGNAADSFGNIQIAAGGATLADLATKLDKKYHAINVLDSLGGQPGADRTGATDSRLAFQRALDTAYARGTNVVYVPAGTYKLSVNGGTGRNISLNPNNEIYGDGDMSIIQRDPTTPTGYAIGVASVYSSDSTQNNYYIHHLRIIGATDGRRSGQTPGQGSDGGIMTNHTAGVSLNKIVIDHVSIYGCNKESIAPWDIKKVYITNCRVSNCNITAFNPERFNRLVMIGNSADSCMYFAEIQAGRPNGTANFASGKDTTNYTLVQDNIGTNIFGYGIQTYTGDHAMYKGNTLSQADGLTSTATGVACGFYINGTNANTSYETGTVEIIGNTINGFVDAGVSNMAVTSSNRKLDRLIIKGNTFENMKGRVITLWGYDKTKFGSVEIQNNSFLNWNRNNDAATSAGPNIWCAIRLDNIDSVTVKDNTFRNEINVYRNDPLLINNGAGIRFTNNILSGYKTAGQTKFSIQKSGTVNLVCFGNNGIGDSTFNVMEAGGMYVDGGLKVNGQISQNGTVAQYKAYMGPDSSSDGLPHAPTWRNINHNDVVDWASGVRRQITATGNATFDQNTGILNVPSSSATVTKSYGYGDTLSHTGDLLETTVWTTTIPANTIGANGGLDIEFATFNNSSASQNKTYKIKVGSVVVAQTIQSSGQATNNHSWLQNANSTHASKMSPVGSTMGNTFATGSTPPTTTTAIDWTVDQTITATITLANAGDVARFDRISIKPFN